MRGKRSGHRTALYMGRRDQISEIFRKRLRWFLTDSAVSIADFARRCGLVDETICGYLNGSRCPTATTLRTIAEASGVSADFWLGLDDTPRRLPIRRASRQ